MAHILSISYNAALLATRELLLKQMGHSVASAEGFARARRICGPGERFDLIILGHTIPHDDKEELIEECTRNCSCPILALLRPNEHDVKGATRTVDSSDPQTFIDTVREMLGEKALR